MCEIISIATTRIDHKCQPSPSIRFRSDRNEGMRARLCSAYFPFLVLFFFFFLFLFLLSLFFFADVRITERMLDSETRAAHFREGGEGDKAWRDAWRLRNFACPRNSINIAHDVLIAFAPYSASYSALIPIPISRRSVCDVRAERNDY